ncbi:MAG: hypothetical protein ACKOAD_02325 [Gammaproteobacteria bacterium]
MTPTPEQQRAMLDEALRQKHFNDYAARQGAQGSGSRVGGIFKNIFDSFTKKLGFDSTRRSGLSSFFSGLFDTFSATSQPYGWGMRALSSVFQLFSGLFMFFFGKDFYKLFGLKPPVEPVEENLSDLENPEEAKYKKASKDFLDSNPSILNAFKEALKSAFGGATSSSPSAAAASAPSASAAAGMGAETKEEAEARSAASSASFGSWAS